MGKTHLSTAICIEAVQLRGKRVRYFSTVKLPQPDAQCVSGQARAPRIFAQRDLLAEIQTFTDSCQVGSVRLPVEVDRPSRLEAVRAVNRNNFVNSRTTPVLADRGRAESD
jgi:hypothetical protein